MDAQVPYMSGLQAIAKNEKLGPIGTDADLGREGEGIEDDYPGCESRSM